MDSAGAQDRENVVRIQHVALEVPAEELERAAEFWRLVGFEPVEPPPTLRERALWFEAGPAGARTQIHLLITEADATPPAVGGGATDAATARRGNHVAIVVPSWDENIAALREADFTIEARRPHWGAARAFATHPGGHTVELMAAPPPTAEVARKESGTQ